MSTRSIPVLEKPQSAETARLRRIVSFARKHLANIDRRSGESYLQHGIEVADVLREATNDVTLLGTAVLHDILVHPQGRTLLRESPLTPKEQTLVRTMHRLRRLHIDENTRDLDTAIEAYGSDSRILILRMAHRLNDVRHMDRFGERLRHQIARETLHMYTAIAGRLGFHWWRYEMEDSCFRMVQPRRALALEREFKRRAALDRHCLEQTAQFLREKLRSTGVTALVTHRIKGLYSTYRKMVIKHRHFGEPTDRLALRIVVPTLEDCYRALGVVHRCMHPMPGKLKDYIGAPKENGHRSIHTVVWPLPGVTEQPIEIQIRTATMDRECEFGCTSHAEYKRLNYVLQTPTSRVNLWRNLQTLRAESRSPDQFETALRSYFDEAHIAVFDAHDNLYHIHKPATARSFLNAVYPNEWKGIKQVRINGRRRPLDTPLHEGDCVEAL